MTFDKTLLLFLTFELALVAYFDLRTRKVPNLWSVLNGVLFFILILFFPQKFPFLLEQLLLPLILLVAGFVLFVLKIMGGGDGKFLSTFFLLLHQSWQNFFFEKILWVTIAFALFFLTLNSFKNRRRILKVIKEKRYSEIKKYYGTFFPFVPILFVSWVWFLVKNFS